MRPEEMRRFGTALAERVSQQVDTEERLRLMVGERRRMRRVQVALAAAAVIAVLLGVLALSRAISGPPVITEPAPTTVAGLRPLPVEVSLVLASDYTVDAATGECSGSGPLSGVAEGLRVSIVDSTGESPALTREGTEIPGPEEVASVALPAGVEMTGAEAPPDLASAVQEAGCVFLFGELDIPVSEFDLVLPGDLDIAMSGTRSGQRHVIVIGG